MEIYADDILPGETDVIVYVHFVDDTDNHAIPSQGRFMVIFENKEVASMTIEEIHKKAIDKAWHFFDKCLRFRNP